MGARVPLALAEEEEGGSEMEKLEKSSMAFFAGLSLISSPDNTAGKKMSKLSLYRMEIQGDEREGEGELTESVRTGLRGLALDPYDDGLPPLRGLRGGGLAGGRRRRHGRRSGRVNKDEGGWTPPDPQ